MADRYSQDISDNYDWSRAEEDYVPDEVPMEPTFTCNKCHTSGSIRWMTTHDCAHQQYVNENGGRCEDYPCCGHTDGDGCGINERHTADYWRNSPHLMCNHETGYCEAEENYDED